MRLVLYGLQHHGLVQEFDVEMFMSFARAYLAKRMVGEGPPRIAYTREHRAHTQKEKKKFRLSFPQASANQEELQKEKKKIFRMSLPPVQEDQDESQKEKKKRFRMSLPAAQAYPDHSQKERRRFRLSFPQAYAYQDRQDRQDDVYGGLM
jgi:hypothetical protein